METDYASFESIADFVPYAERFESSVHYRFMRLALCLWWLATLYPLIQTNQMDSTLMEAADSVSQGDIGRQLLVLSFALLGIVHLPRALETLRYRPCRVFAGLLIAYLVWSACSVGWSIDRGLTIRRENSFILIVTGAFGLGAGFYGRSRDGLLILARHVFFAGISAVAALIGSRLLDGSLLQFLDPRWSLKDSTQIAGFAFPAGYAMLASLAIYESRSFMQLFAAFWLFLVMMILKGRTMMADAAAAMLLAGSRFARTSPIRTVLSAAAIGLTATLLDLASGGKVVIAVLQTGSDIVAGWLPYLTVGEGMKNLTSLSGRLPLWQALYEYISARPLTGYGFGAFWTADRFDEMHSVAGWRAVVAHNGFLDELLATGAIGLALFLCFWFYAMWVGASGFSRYGLRQGYLVFGWLFLYLMFNSLESIFQTFFQFPILASFTAIFTMFAVFRMYEEDAWAAVYEEG